MDASRPSSKIRFDTFEVDLHSCELRKHGYKIRIQPQPMKVLMLLLERPGVLVTRDELRRRLWPDQLYVDFELGLNRSINKLRRALLDDANSPRYVETLSTRGYRFIASVDIEPKPNAALTTDFRPDSREVSPVAHSHWNRGVVLATGVAALMASSFVVAWRPIHPSRGTSALRTGLRPVPLVTFANGTQSLPAFSPDGSRIAYSLRTGEGWFLEVKDVGADTHIRLTQRPAGSPPGPAWSPDGRQIAFARAGVSDDRGVFIISAMGGPERKLCSLPLSNVPQRVVSWSPDGRWIAFADKARRDPGAKPNSPAPNAIYLISPETSERRQVTQPPPGDYGDNSPAFSPDGATIAFIRTRASSKDEVYSVPVQGGSPRPLVTGQLWTNGLAWAADGKSIVYDGSQAGEVHLWRVSSSGTTLPLDIPCEFACLEPTVWRDQLAYEAHISTQTVGRVALNGSYSESPITPIASTRIEYRAQFSPNGQHIAFLSDRTGRDELWVADADGANPVQLTHLKTPLVDLSWDAKGNSIAVSAYSGKVYLVSFESQGLRLLFDGPQFTDENARTIAFSRNGDFFYVLSEPGMGESYDLLKVPVAGGAPTKVVSGRITNFAESMDGKTLFYSRDDRLWKRLVEGGTEQYVAPSSGIWDIRPDGLYLLTNSSSIERYSLDGKPLQTVAKLGQFWVVDPMSVSADGRWAIFGYERRQTVEIDMVQGFN